MKPNEMQLNELMRLCDTCRRASKCKDHNKMCIAKKIVWNLSVKVYKKRVKKGLIKENENI